MRGSSSSVYRLNKGAPSSFSLHPLEQRYRNVIYEMCLVHIGQTYRSSAVDLHLGFVVGWSRPIDIRLLRERRHGYIKQLFLGLLLSKTVFSSK